MRTPLARMRPNTLHHRRARHEVGRDDQDVLAGLLHQLQQAIDHGVARVHLVVAGPILPGLSTISSGRRPGQRDLAQVHGWLGAGTAWRDVGQHGRRVAAGPASPPAMARRRVGRCAAACAALQLFGRHQRLHRVGQLVVPVAVEAGGHVAHDAADGQHVQVDEVAARRRCRNRHRPRLRPPVMPMALSAMNSLLCMRFWMRGTSFSDVMTRPISEAREPGSGIEQADLDVGLEGQAQHLGVLAHRVEVVEQDADAHAAPRGIAQRLQQHFGAGVGVDGVVLQVQAALRRLDQRQAAGKGGADAVQQPEAGVTARAALALCAAAPVGRARSAPAR